MTIKTGTKLGILALTLAVGTTFLWFAMTATVGLPSTRIGFVIGFAAAIGIGVFSYFKGTSILGAIPPALAIVISGFLSFTIYISPQALDTNTSISVGDTIPSFTAPTDTEEVFDSASLHGHLVLIKFFRAHW